MMKASCLLIALSLAQATLAHSPMNQLKIETIGRKMKDVIGADILKNRELLQQIANLQKSEAKQIYKYIDESLENLSNDIFLTMSEMKNNTEANIVNIKKTMKENLDNMNDKVKKNDQKMIESMIGLNGSALSLTEKWIRERSEAIEDIVSSRLSVCGHTQHHISPGVVSYDNTLQSNTKDIRILGETIKWEDVFDLKRGEFTVPKGGAGEYLVAATVVMDVHSHQAKLNKDRMVISHYRFLLNGYEELEDAPLYSDAGKDSEADLVQASRSIVWHLQEGESLSLKKKDTRNILSPDAALDHRITFCVTLLTLDQSLSLDLASPPRKKNAVMDKWVYEDPPAIISSPISSSSPPTHPSAKELTKPIPSTEVSKDCSLSETCKGPSVTTTITPKHTDNDV